MALDLRQGAVEDAALRPDVEDRKSRVACFSDKGSTFKFSCEGGRRIPMQEQLAVIDVLCGRAAMWARSASSNPSTTFTLETPRCRPRSTTFHPFRPLVLWPPAVPHHHVVRRLQAE